MKKGFLLLNNMFVVVINWFFFLGIVYLFVKIDMLKEVFGDCVLLFFFD